jgi:processing peptidase subunit alpha
MTIMAEHRRPLHARRKTVDTFTKEMQAVTPQDLSSLVTKLLKTPPTVATLGDIANVPRYDAIASRFR